MKIETKGQMQGLIKMVAVKPDGSERVLADWFPNLITDSGLDYFGGGIGATYSDFYKVCRVGTSSAVPSVNDTALGAHVAQTQPNDGTTVAGGAASTSPYYWWARRRYRFQAGVAAGNLSEVGIGDLLGTGPLFSRALIKDALGNPTTITVLADEILDVYYELRMYFPDEGDSVYNVVIDGVPTTITMRLAAITQYTGGSGGASGHSASNPLSGLTYKTVAYLWSATAIYYGGATTLGAITNKPSAPSSLTLWDGSFDGTPYGTWATLGYTLGSYYRDLQLVVGLDYLNALAGGGISGMAIRSTRGHYQLKFDPPIAKVYTKILTITWRFSWERRP